MHSFDQIKVNCLLIRSHHVFYFKMEWIITEQTQKMLTRGHLATASAREKNSVI